MAKETFSRGLLLFSKQVGESKQLYGLPPTDAAGPGPNAAPMMNSSSRGSSPSRSLEDAKVQSLPLGLRGGIFCNVQTFG